MQTRKRITALFLMVIMIAVIAACAADNAPAEVQPTQPTEAPTEAPTDTENGGDIDDEPELPAPVIDRDREGNPIVLPETIERIISMGPSNTEVLVALGFADRIVATDAFSDNIDGIDPSIAIFSMMDPDGEQIIYLQPDVIFVTGMTRVGADDPFRIVADAGICVIFIPSSTSIEGIKEDIRFMAAVMGAEAIGEELIEDMETAIDEVRQMAATITERRTVYFEISPAPWMVSFGAGTFLNEMLEIVGVENIFADEEGWISVADEFLLAANPDVILTSVNFIDDPIEDIVNRPGWGGITAVQNGDVFRICTDASNRPSHNIVIALREMASAIYPEVF
ncbi:MAG: ABC transporter substrate-binding protein [Oscillospiraceae bacterium]|nr:ABC transporter substrate-binding protein [Oscillospiraceae bacterium]